MTTTMTRETRAAGKRERILRAAVETFAQYGYYTARVGDIAREAGVADGTIYLYFSGKEDLLISIFREHMRDYLVALAEELSDAPDAIEKLRRVIRFHLASLGADRALAVVFQVELRQSRKFMSQLSHEEVADYLNLLRSIIADGQTEGLLHSGVHPQLAAKMLFGVLDELISSWILSEKDYRPDEQAESVADVVLRGLVRR